MSDVKSPTHFQEFLAIYADRMERALTDGEIETKNTFKHEIVISFTAKYRPFIPPRDGLTPVNDMIWIKECAFTKQLGLDLMEYRISNKDRAGGRVFIRLDGTYVKDAEMAEIKISNLRLE